MGLLHLNGPGFRINGECRTQRPQNRNRLCTAIPCKSRASLSGNRFPLRKTTRNPFPEHIRRQNKNSGKKSLTPGDPHNAAGKTHGLSPNGYCSEAVLTAGCQPENGLLIHETAPEMQINTNSNLAGSVKSLKNHQSGFFNDGRLRIPRSGF